MQHLVYPMNNGVIPFRPIDSQNLRDQIESQVRSALLNGTLKPGQRLVESNIAEQLQVSRAPIREALSALEREGILQHVPRRGYQVVDFTDKDIEEIYSLRLLLEIGALERIGRPSDQNLAKLQGIVDRLGDAVRQYGTRSPSVIAVDLSFHELVCTLADHSRLLSAWSSMRLQTRLLIGLTSTTHLESSEEPHRSHQRIVDALKKGDIQRAEACLSDHILDAQHRALVAWKELGRTEERTVVNEDPDR